MYWRASIKLKEFRSLTLLRSRRFGYCWVFFRFESIGFSLFFFQGFGSEFETLLFFRLRYSLFFYLRRAARSLLISQLSQFVRTRFLELGSIAGKLTLFLTGRSLSRSRSSLPSLFPFPLPLLLKLPGLSGSLIFNLTNQSALQSLSLNEFDSQKKFIIARWLQFVAMDRFQNLRVGYMKSGSLEFANYMCLRRGLERRKSMSVDILLMTWLPQQSSWAGTAASCLHSSIASTIPKLISRIASKTPNTNPKLMPPLATLTSIISFLNTFTNQFLSINSCSISCTQAQPLPISQISSSSISHFCQRSSYLCIDWRIVRLYQRGIQKERQCQRKVCFRVWQLEGSGGQGSWGYGLGFGVGESGCSYCIVCYNVYRLFLFRRLPEQTIIYLSIPSQPGPQILLIKVNRQGFLARTTSLIYLIFNSKSAIS